jgi:adenylate kinase family enzyme
MNERISIFQNETIPVLDNFKELWKLIEINADDTIENIFKETCEKLWI